MRIKFDANLLKFIKAAQNVYNKISTTLSKYTHLKMKVIQINNLNCLEYQIF
jgi:hypothetical protein